MSNDRPQWWQPDYSTQQTTWTSQISIHARVVVMTSKEGQKYIDDMTTCACIYNWPLHGFWQWRHCKRKGSGKLLLIWCLLNPLSKLCFHVCWTQKAAWLAHEVRVKTVGLRCDSTKNGQLTEQQNGTIKNSEGCLRWMFEHQKIISIL